MTDIEPEEGEAYFPQDGDDHNIDPDKDFSYIDKKIENVLGHYQKDFMGGLSAENLGARFGGYGSFLPMQQRSPPILSNQRTPSHISSKSPHNLPSEHFPENAAAAAAVANHSLSVRSGSTSSDHSIQALPESGICSMNNQSKLKSLHDASTNDQKKKLMVHHTAQKSLKLRVKMTSESAFSRDNAAIYSGLGLDMSPSSSLEDSPLEDYGTSPGVQELKAESPSYIVQTMTSFPLPDKEMLSPLHHSLVCLVGTEINPETLLLEYARALRLEGKNEANKDSISKVKNPTKDRKSKQTETSKERKSKKKSHVKAVKLVKETHKYPANAVALSANKREESVTSLAKDVVLSKASTNAIVALYEEKEPGFLMGKIASSRESDLFNKRGGAGGLEGETEKSVRQVQIAGDKAKGKSVAILSCDAAVMEEGNVKALIGMAEKEKNFSSIMSKESHMDKGNKVGFEEEEANKLSKRPTMTKNKVIDVVLNSRFPKEDSVYEKENGTRKIPEDQRAGFSLIKAVEEKDRHNNVSGKAMALNMETPKPSKKKSHLKVMPDLRMGGQKERLSSLAKKKGRESQTDNTSSAEPPRGNLMGSSLAVQSEETILGSNIPYKSKRDGVNLQREMRKASGLDGNVNPGVKGKDLSRKDPAMGVSDRKLLAYADKLKEKPSSKEIGFDPNIGFNMEGHLSGGNSGMEKVPVGNVLPTEIEDWVECVKCKKWRLLPLGMGPDSLPKKWTCSMITWLPGKNSCSVSEEETTNGLRALYQVPMLGHPMQNVQLANPDGTASVYASVGAQHADAIPAGGRKKNLVKTQIIAPRQSGFQEHIHVKKDQQLSGEMKRSKHQKKLRRELDAVGTTGDCKPSKLEKKRVIDSKASGVAKKMKRVHQQSMENVGLPTGESQNYDLGAQRISNDFAKRSLESPLAKAKDRPQNAMSSRNTESKDVSRTKRKLKDQLESVVSTEQLSVDGKHQMNNWVTGKSSGTEHRKEKKLKVSNIQGRECSTGKGNGRTGSHINKHNQGGSSIDSIQKGGRMGYVALEGHHADKASQKTGDSQKSSEKMLDLGLSDNGTTSSSSKISYKVKAKVKCSPVGSSSSSSLMISKADYDNEPEKLSAKQVKFKGEGAPTEIASHKDEMRERKSNLSRNPGILADAVDQDHSVRKISAGRHPDAHGMDKPKLEGHKDASGKLKRILHERVSLTSQEKLVLGNQDAGSLKGLHFHANNSEKGKSNVSLWGTEKDPACHSHGLPEIDKVYESNAMRVDNFNSKPQPAGYVSKAIEASSSMKKDILHWDPNTALKEATNLKDSVDHLKISGSGHESTEAIFQAALKFLHGASLLEPGSSNGGKYGEMTPTAAYNTTARLCEHCAREYERCNDMASAALAYKCMEVAYMRVVYSSDLAASRDRVELDMAVKAAPQVESPSSSASDIDSLNNQAVGESLKDGNSLLDQRNHVISAGNRPNFVRLLNFTQHVNLAMEASRRSQIAFAAANPVLAQAGIEEGIAFIKRVLDFSFHDIDGLLHLMRLAMEALNTKTLKP